MARLDPNVINVSYIADFYRRYPGELITFFVRFSLNKPIRETISLQVNLPNEMKPIIDKSVALSNNQGQAWLKLQPRRKTWKLRTVEEERQYNVLFWKIDGRKLEPNREYEYRVQGKILIQDDNFLKSWVSVAGLTQDEETDQELEYLVLESEVATIQVEGKAQALMYLPEIYQEANQNLLWRYLMIFDSFWNQFEDRLLHLPYYFDSHLAPLDFQPWLASWVGLTWDERLPLKRRQNLRLKILELYRKRGTKIGLQSYLQVCFDVSDEDVDEKIVINESPIGNFILGDDIQLGESLIMGSPEEVACRFTVTIDKNLLDEKVNETFAREIISDWRPAHTTYELFLV